MHATPYQHVSPDVDLSLLAPVAHESRLPLTFYLIALWPPRAFAESPAPALQTLRPTACRIRKPQREVKVWETVSEMTGKTTSYCMEHNKVYHFYVLELSRNPAPNNLGSGIIQQQQQVSKSR